MNVGELRKLLEGYADDVEVVKMIYDDFEDCFYQKKIRDIDVGPCEILKSKPVKFGIYYYPD